MPTEITYLPTDIDDGSAYLGAAAYLSVIAYPNEIRRRDKFLQAYKALMVKLAIRKGGDRSTFRRDLRAYENRKINNQIDMVRKRIATRRLPAWKIAVYLKLSHVGPDFMYQRRYSVNQHLSDLYDNDPDKISNAYKRIWTESKPVLHLLFGLRDAYPGLDTNHFHCIDKLLLDTSWLLPSLRTAELARRIILCYPHFNICEEQTIQLLPEHVR